VPNLIGLELSKAEEVLTKQKLRLEIREWRWSSEVPSRYILAQEPTKGFCLRRGRKVKVVVSRGAKLIKMPNLCKMKLSEAKNHLQKNGLLLGKLSWIFSDEAKNTIITHTPLPGSLVQKGSKVNLLVSKGEREQEIVMPNLIGREIREVERVLKKLGIILSEVSYQENQRLPQGVVLEQSIPAGFSVKKWQRVKLVVNKHPQKLLLLPQEVEIEYITPPGLIERRVRIVITAGGKIKEVYNKLCAPLEQVRVKVKKRKGAKVKIYLDGVLVEERKLTSLQR
jgi:serine/threonine-protein kinase